MVNQKAGQYMNHVPQISFWRLMIISFVAAVFVGSLQAQTLTRVEQSDFGKTQDGSDVKLITLRNAHGMSVQVITYGAIIKQLRAPDRDGKFANVLLTVDTIRAIPAWL